MRSGRPAAYLDPRGGGVRARRRRALRLHGRKVRLEVGDTDEEARAIILGVFTTQQQILVRCVEAAQRHGDLDPAADACAVACMVLALNRGMDVLAKGGIARSVLDAAAEQAFRGLPLTAR